MGLDMYLTARLGIYTSLYEGHGELQKAIRDLLDKAGVTDDAMPLGAGGEWSDIGEVKGVDLRAAYWRKANAIHGWFVANVQGGEDRCDEHAVSREQLSELRDLCKGILDMPPGHARDSHAAESLPPTSGFFFGNTDIGEGYYADLADTVKQLDAALKLPDSWDFFYQSSW